jgi:TRAP-type uncharacterized transport system substrate-binding protein
VKIRVLATAAALVLLAAAAHAKDAITLASGEKGGTYSDVYGKNLKRALSPSGWDLTIRHTKGSAENLDLLAEGEVDLAFAQADVYALRMEEEPDVFGELKIVGAFAEECVYVARRKSDGPKTLRDLGEDEEGDVPTVSLGAFGSGMSDSWNYIVTLIPDISVAELDYTASTAALDKLSSGDIDAAAWITDPNNFDHKMAVAVHKNKELELMPIEDAALLDELPNGRKVYSIKSIKTSRGARTASFKTVCTDAVIFARPDADPKLVKRVVDTAGRLVPKR